VCGGGCGCERSAQPGVWMCCVCGCVYSGLPRWCGVLGFVCVCFQFCLCGGACASVNVRGRGCGLGWVCVVFVGSCLVCLFWFGRLLSVCSALIWFVLFGLFCVGFLVQTVLFWSAFQLACSGLVWSGLVWSGLVWSGLVWSVLVWSGLFWSGLFLAGLFWSVLVCRRGLSAVLYRGV
jgi:hypothetical protein